MPTTIKDKNTSTTPVGIKILKAGFGYPTFARTNPSRIRTPTAPRTMPPIYIFLLITITPNSYVLFYHSETNKSFISFFTISYEKNVKFV